MYYNIEIKSDYLKTKKWIFVLSRDYHYQAFKPSQSFFYSTSMNNATILQKIADLHAKQNAEPDLIDKLEIANQIRKLNKLLKKHQQEEQHQHDLAHAFEHQAWEDAFK